MPLRYAMFLLNQNINQMRLWLGASDRYDYRCSQTLFNLLRLMWQSPRTISELPPRSSALDGTLMPPDVMSMSPQQMAERIIPWAIHNPLVCDGDESDSSNQRFVLDSDVPRELGWCWGLFVFKFWFRIAEKPKLQTKPNANSMHIPYVVILW